MRQQCVSFHDVWLAPLALACVTVLGLLIALLGNSGYRWIAWLCLAIPIAVVLWFACRPRC